MDVILIILLILALLIFACVGVVLKFVLISIFTAIFEKSDEDELSA